MKLGFFFGAGAEVGYGLPIGGKFAIDLFRQDVSEHKQALRDQLKNLNQYDTYVTGWLPEKYSTQRIHAFGKNEFTSLIESSIEYRKSEIIRRLNDFDVEADKALQDLGIDKQVVVDKFNSEMDHAFGDQLFSTAVQMNSLLSDQVRLFGCEMYSAMLSVLRVKENTADLQRYAGAFLQLLVGAHGQELVQRLNQELFEAAPDDIPIFDDVSGMFKVEFSQAGLSALELLMESKREYDIANGSISDLLSALAQQLLENIFTTVLDYQSLIDSHFRYLYSPKTEWAKFSKMVIFLWATRKYIKEQLDRVGSLPDSGYYHDLKRCEELGIQISAIGTANYNNLIETVAAQLDYQIPNVHQLNGGVCDFYNPYKNSVVSCQDENDVPKDQLHVPFILTQSGLKPLTSVDMSRRYVSLFDSYSNCDAIVVIGYGFNIDDSHINGLFRQLIEDNDKSLYWVCLDTDGNAEVQKRVLVQKLRISALNRNKVHVIPVSPSDRLLGGVSWLDSIKSVVEQE
ncbi:hypothetical protein AB9R81_00975 [Vibrio cyclitrophicus]